MVPTTDGGLHEQSANGVIARWLNTIGRNWRADAERTSRVESSNERPDIIIKQGDRMPVVIECEWEKPAVADAKRLIGKNLVGEPRRFTEVIAVGIDPVCKTDTEEALQARLNRNEPIFTIQLVSQAKGGPEVWPDRPLPASASDLAAYCEYGQVPQALIEDHSARIANKIETLGAKLLDSIQQTGNLSSSTLSALRVITGSEHWEQDPKGGAVTPSEQSDRNTQATRTACAIWLVAIDLQNDLAQFSSELQSRNLRTTQMMKNAAIARVLTASEMLNQWEIIATVNYLPVIELAIESLSAGPMGNGLADILEELHEISEQLNGLHAKHIYNFAGELWQRLVTDREERAAHYTRPEIAELLASISAERFSELTTEQIAALNLMDAACGTGTLIGAGERAIRRKYFSKGGRDAELHRKRMEEHIYAMDVNGIAGTLTAKRLTDMDVEQDYSSSKIAVITDLAGSLILLDPSITGISRVLGYRSVTPTKGIGGEDGYFHVRHVGINWSLMNPPYSRPRKDRQQATRGLARLRRAAKRWKHHMSHGQAGLGSDFGNMTNIRLAPGGIYSTVLPMTAAHSPSWKAWRRELEKDFQDIVVIANTAPGELQSMSADTAMGEILVVATKKSQRPTIWSPTNILCVNLHTSPTSMAEGYAIAREIANIPNDDWQGVIPHGNYSWAKQVEAGFPWGAVGNTNNEVTVVNEALLAGKAYDPGTLQTLQLGIPMTTLKNLAETGPTHHLIGYVTGNDPMGAFEWTPLGAMVAPPSQQSMWAADSEHQKTISASPTHGGTIRKQSEATRMAQQRSKWFISRNIRWTSQALAIASTAHLSHGGRAWNALQDIDDDVGKCLALYFNSIFGAIVWNSYGQSTQAGRAPIQVNAIAGLPCPDFSASTPAGVHARRIARENFDKLSTTALEPFAYCFRDWGRHEIDSVVAQMLGLDPEDSAVQAMLGLYRRLFCSEPNVNGRQRSIMTALDSYYHSS